uniref:SD25037p n=1 Tax=Drosophila melanogaster TaxID=7227 RepID=Q8MR91_DROME|nr:SD25037p [Drosophila melanogaster]
MLFCRCLSALGVPFVRRFPDRIRPAPRLRNSMELFHSIRYVFNICRTPRRSPCCPDPYRTATGRPCGPEIPAGWVSWRRWPLRRPDPDPW